LEVIITYAFKIALYWFFKYIIMRRRRFCWSFFKTDKKCTIINACLKCIYEWKKDPDKRTDLLHDFAQELRKNKEELARTATKEMGKAIKEARSEVEKCAWAMEYFADNGKIFTTDEVINAYSLVPLHQ
jgi:delta 1-pyrroline-5-carboxylate dehydrogenase